MRSDSAPIKARVTGTRYADSVVTTRARLAAAWGARRAADNDSNISRSTHSTVGSFSASPSDSLQRPSQRTKLARDSITWLCIVIDGVPLLLLDREQRIELGQVEQPLHLSMRALKCQRARRL